MATIAVVASRAPAVSTWAKWRTAFHKSKFFFNTTDYDVLGLRFDDLLSPTPEVEEGIRRLPQKLKDERNFRIVRAAFHVTWHRDLPKEQWTKFEEDDRYLSELVEEVRRESAERKKWDNM